MASYLQKLARKREQERAVTVLPVLNVHREEHEEGCGCGEAGCGDDADGSCC